MPAVFEISTDGKTLQLIFTEGNFYIMPEGDLLPICTAPARCYACGKFVEAELISKTVDEYDVAIAEREYYFHHPGYRPHDRSQLRYLSGGSVPDIKRWRTWRIARKSRPKCLLCGSTDIFLFDPAEKVFDVSGVGRVDVRMRAIASGTHYNSWYFTPEGDRIDAR